ncbi:MAG: response regulator transcription factor [Bacteroidales bacterium]|nr:response regulator transcription factor [Bacteroidales bacterium]
MKNQLSILLVEDEDYNLRLLEGMLRKLRPEWHLAGSFDSIGAVVSRLKNNPQPDLIFMDIQLADGLCFDIFKLVNVESMVIFTTAFDNYAVQAFKVNSIDYLLKPFREEELKKAIEKFEAFSGLANPARLLPDYPDIVQAIRNGEKKYRKRFLVSKGDGFIKLEIDDIAYFHNENRVTTAITFQNQSHFVDFALDALEDQLDPEKFYRANRQLIVNLKAVERIENHFGGKLKLRLRPPFEGDMMVSRLKAMSFKHWMEQ